jgi:probable rRNA maturation factor
MTRDKIAVIVQEEFIDLISEDQLHHAIEVTYLQTGVLDSPSFSVLISDNEHIQEMNQRYRGINKPTDVLAFREEFNDPDLESRYLGDMVISYEQALNQAQMRGHPVDEELQLLVVHGTLHLLGYDHETTSDKEVMWSMQNEILSSLGLNIEVEDMIE